MKVLFIKSVKGIGKEGEVKEVSSGYAQNMLFPRRIAIEATPHAIERIEREVMAKAGKKEVSEALIEKMMKELNGKEIVIERKANEKGKLFEKVHEDDIAQALKQTHHIDIAHSCITLPKPIDMVGEYTVSLSHGGFKSSVKCLIK